MPFLTCSRICSFSTIKVSLKWVTFAVHALVLDVGNGFIDAGEPLFDFLVEPEDVLVRFGLVDSLVGGDVGKVLLIGGYLLLEFPDLLESRVVLLLD